MSADDLLAKLDRVRQTGADSWTARCPAHTDGSPSLSIRALADGRVLLHCFAGCEVAAVVGAVGLQLEALFPPRPIDHAKPLRRPFPAADVLAAVMRDALAVQQIAVYAMENGSIQPAHREILRGAAGRIASANDLVNG